MTDDEQLRRRAASPGRAAIGPDQLARPLLREQPADDHDDRRVVGEAELGPGSGPTRVGHPCRHVDAVEDDVDASAVVAAGDERLTRRTAEMAIKASAWASDQRSIQPIHAGLYATCTWTTERARERRARTHSSERVAGSVAGVDDADAPAAHEGEQPDEARRRRAAWRPRRAACRRASRRRARCRSRPARWWCRAHRGSPRTSGSGRPRQSCGRRRTPRARRGRDDG